MADNNPRRGAKRKPGTKKGPTAGSGGLRRKSLEGRGPTPKAEHRTGHPAARRATAAAKRAPSEKERAQDSGAQDGRARGSRPGQGRAGQGRSGRAGTETVAGRNPVVEALRAGVPASALYVGAYLDSDDRVRESLRIAADRGIPLLEAPRPELDRITGGAVHQGLALQVPPYPYAHPDDLLHRAAAFGQTPLVVALDGVTDPRNLGAVVRSAAAFGAHGVVVPERRAAGMTAGAWKASAGAASRVPVARATNLTRTLEAYRKAGLVTVGLAANGSVTVDALDAAVDPLVVVIGSEGKGLSRLVAQTCDLTVRIPMAAGTESLNAGVAAGIVLYEVARRRL